jgi:hypothetical protein
MAYGQTISNYTDELAQQRTEMEALSAPLHVHDYVCPLLQEIFVAQQQIAEGLEIAERCRGRALAQRLTFQSWARGELPESQPPTFAQIHAIAAAQQATLVAYTVLVEPLRLPKWIPSRESGLLIWVVSPSGQVTQRRVDLRPGPDGGAESLAEVVALTRQALGVRGRGSPAVRPTGRGVLVSDGVTVSAPASRAVRHPRLQQLYTLLIEPIADVLPADPEARIIVVPQDSLFLVPFAALQDPAGTYVVETHTISVAPSIHTLALTHRQGQERKAVPSRMKAALIIGNPSMPTYAASPDDAPQPLPNLPGAEEEAHAVAALLQAKALTGRDATKAAVLARVPQATRIHLATHGLLDHRDAAPWEGLGREATLKSVTDAAGSITTPGALALAPGNGDSGLLTAAEIARLKTHAALVVLSACDTGRGPSSATG